MEMYKQNVISAQKQLDNLLDGSDQDDIKLPELS
jgi:hypothetical protein